LVSKDGVFLEIVSCTSWWCFTWVYIKL